MPYFPDDRAKLYGYVIVDPAGDRPYFCHDVPKEFADASRERGGSVHMFVLSLPKLKSERLELGKRLDGHLPQEPVYADIIAERERQDRKYPVTYENGTGGAFAVAASTLLREVCTRAFQQRECTFAHVLAEEVGEALAESDEVRLRAELVQVAGVCVKWIEALDSRRREIDDVPW